MLPQRKQHNVSKEDLEWYKNASLFNLTMQKALKREQRKEKIRTLFKRKKYHT